MALKMEISALDEQNLITQIETVCVSFELFQKVHLTFSKLSCIPYPRAPVGDAFQVTSF